MRGGGEMVYILCKGRMNSGSLLFYKLPWLSIEPANLSRSGIVCC